MLAVVLGRAAAAATLGALPLHPLGVSLDLPRLARLLSDVVSLHAFRALLLDLGGALLPLLLELLRLLDALLSLLLLVLRLLRLLDALLLLLLILRRLLRLLDALLALRVLRRGLRRGGLHLRAPLLEALAHDGITRLVRVAA